MNSDQKLFQVFFTIRPRRQMGDGSEDVDMQRNVWATSEDDACTKIIAYAQISMALGSDAEVIIHDLSQAIE